MITSCNGIENPALIIFVYLTISYKFYAPEAVLKILAFFTGPLIMKKLRSKDWNEAFFFVFAYVDAQSKAKQALINIVSFH